MSLPSLSLKNPVTVFMMTCLLTILGLVSLFSLPIELMPQQENRTLSVITRVRGGISPQEVEILVTNKIEEAMAEVTYLRQMSSISREGESVVILRFQTQADMDLVATEVREKMAGIKDDLPSEIEHPVIALFDYQSRGELVISVTSDVFNAEDIRMLADDHLKKELLSVDGVANVDVYGGRERKILVEIDQPQLSRLQVSIEEIMSRLGLSNLDVMAGSIEKEQQKIFIRTKGEFQSIQEIREIPILTQNNGRIIKLQDVAQVKDSYLESNSYARVNQVSGVTLNVQKKSGANSLKVGRDVVAVTDQLRVKYPHFFFDVIYNNGEYIEKAIHSVKISLLFGGILVSVVLLLFLRQLGLVFTVLITMPIALVSSFFVMKLIGLTINIMTLSGLALGLGMLTDSAFVIIENIVAKGSRVLAKREIIRSTEQVLPAVTASTMTTIIVFLPLIYLNEELKAIFAPIAMTITISLVISLLVSLSLIPVLIRYWSSRGRRAVGRKGFLRRLQKFYQSLLSVTLRNQATVLVIILALFFTSVLFLRQRGLELSVFEENEFTARITPPAGAKLDIVDQMAKQLEDHLEKQPDIETVSTSVTKNDPRIVVKLVSPAKRHLTKTQIVAEIREYVKQFPNFFVYFEGSETEKKAKELVIDVYGRDDQTVTKLGNTIAQKLGQSGRFIDVKISNKQAQDGYGIVIDSRRAALYELTVADIAQTIHAEVRGMRATKYHDQGKELEIVTRLDRSFVQNLEQIKNLEIINRKGKRIYLKQVASFIPAKGPVTVYHKDKFRTFQVSADMGNMDMKTAADVVKGFMSEVEFPRHYFYKFGEGYQELIQGRDQLLRALGLALILIYMLLAPLFRSYFQPVIVMLTVPLAVIGVALVVFLKGLNISNGVIMGSIMLVGIIVNNSILLVHQINFFLQQGRPIVKSVLTASTSRLRPILMTTLTTVIGMVPLTLKINETSELWRSMALTVIGGLSISAILTLIVIPNVYFIYHRIFKTLRSKSPVPIIVHFAQK